MTKRPIVFLHCHQHRGDDPCAEGHSNICMNDIVGFQTIWIDDQPSIQRQCIVTVSSGKRYIVLEFDLMQAMEMAGMVCN